MPTAPRTDRDRMKPSSCTTESNHSNKDRISPDREAIHTPESANPVTGRKVLRNRKVRPDSFYQAIIERIKRGEYMTHIAAEIGIDTSTLCRNLYYRPHLQYRQAIIERHHLFIERSLYKMAQAGTKEEHAKALRGVRLARLAACRYAPEVFGEYQRVRSRNKWGHTGIDGNVSAVQGIELETQAIENTAEHCDADSEMPPDMPPHESS